MNAESPAALAAGAALAAAEVTKYVWVILYPLWAILWLMTTFGRASSRKESADICGCR